jgi:hypothetical protein
LKFNVNKVEERVEVVRGVCKSGVVSKKKGGKLGVKGEVIYVD